ncbi:MAG: hypothetical protein GX663_08285 [Clostridiales bacterium]|nr:hypothetical protein [Clostridiales bacterium]
MMYLGNVLPYAIIGMLLSIICGVALHMVLIRLFLCKAGIKEEKKVCPI